MVSLLGQWNYKFPKPIPLTKTMKDYLEDEVDEKYYINSEKAQKLIQQLMESGQLQKTQEISYCLDANYWKGTTAENFIDKHRRQLVVENEIQQVGSINSSQDGVVALPSGISKTLTSGHNNQPKILINERSD